MKANILKPVQIQAKTFLFIKWEGSLLPFGLAQLDTRFKNFKCACVDCGSLESFPNLTETGFCEDCSCKDLE